MAEAEWENILSDPQLYRAAVGGDISTLINSGRHLHLLGTPIENTILHIYLATTTQRDIQFVQQLLQRSPTLLSKANKGNEDIPLHVAARYGHAQIVQELLSRAMQQYHANVENGLRAVRDMLRTKNKMKNTALHEAVRNNCIEVVQILIQRDPDLEYFANDYGETPFYLAVAGGHDGVVQEMLQRCTYLSYNGTNGTTVLHAAVIAYLLPNIIEQILNRQRSLSWVADDKGWTPLHYAAYIGYSLAARTILEIDKSAAYAANNPRKMTALHLAASRDNVETLKEIISQCPDCCELVDARGWNVLHYAGLTQSTRVINEVLNNPPLHYLVNQSDAKGKTPLHLHAAVLKPGLPNLIYARLRRGKKLLLNSPQEQEEALKWMEDLGSAPMGKIVTIEEGIMSIKEHSEEIN